VQQEEKAQADITLHQLRMDSGRVGLATMLEEIAKLRRIRELGLPDDLFPGIARKVLVVYRNRASIEEPSRLRAHTRAKRLTLLSALCFLRAQEITDALVDLLIHIVHKIDVRAEKRVEQEYLNEFKRVGNKEGIRYRVAEAAVGHPDESVRNAWRPRGTPLHFITRVRIETERRPARAPCVAHGLIPGRRARGGRLA
jgi:hypothetical protein